MTDHGFKVGDWISVPIRSLPMSPWRRFLVWLGLRSAPHVGGKYVVTAVASETVVQTSHPPE